MLLLVTKVDEKLKLKTIYDFTRKLNSTYGKKVT